MSICLSEQKDLANRWIHMVLLKSDASYRSLKVYNYLRVKLKVVGGWERLHDLKYKIMLICVISYLAFLRTFYLFIYLKLINKGQNSNDE